jgi:hypothetical protein
LKNAVMRGKQLLPSAAACAATFAALYYVVATRPYSDATTILANPEDTSMSARMFRSQYFGMTFALRAGWKLGATGHLPSQSGEYVLGTVIPEGEHAGAIVVTAQDMFFSAAPHDDTATLIEDFRQATAKTPGMKINRQPSCERVGGKAMWRVDFDGVGLFRSMFVTDLRCHYIRITMTAPSPETLVSLVHNLDNLSFESKASTPPAVPVCVKGYATAETTLRQINPAMVGGPYAPIPVRVIIATDGGVKWVHVIHASPEQRRSIEDAVRQWKFGPHVESGFATEVETDLLFRVTPGTN